MDASRYVRVSTRVVDEACDDRCKKLTAELERMRYERDALARAYARYVHKHLGLRYTETAT